MPELIGSLMLVGGAVFLLLGGVGLIRMPDVLNRIQAGAKAVTLGTLFTLIGIALMRPEWALKLVLIALFILFTNPLSAQVLARAAHRLGGATDAKLTTVDRLAEDTAKAQQ